MTSAPLSADATEARTNPPPVVVTDEKRSRDYRLPLDNTTEQVSRKITWENTSEHPYFWIGLVGVPAWGEMRNTLVLLPTLNESANNVVVSPHVEDRLDSLFAAARQE